VSDLGTVNAPVATTGSRAPAENTPTGLFDRPQSPAGLHGDGFQPEAHHPERNGEQLITDQFVAAETGCDPGTRVTRRKLRPCTRPGCAHARPPGGTVRRSPGRYVSWWCEEFADELVQLRADAWRHALPRRSPALRRTATRYLLLRSRVRGERIAVVNGAAFCRACSSVTPLAIERRPTIMTHDPSTASKITSTPAANNPIAATGSFLVRDASSEPHQIPGR